MTRITELTPLLKHLQLGPMAATLTERITPGQKGATGLRIIPGDYLQRLGQPSRPTAYRTPAQ